MRLPLRCSHFLLTGSFASDKQATTRWHRTATRYGYWCGLQLNDERFNRSSWRSTIWMLG